MKKSVKIKKTLRPLLSCLLAVGIMLTFVTPTFADIGDNIGGGSGGSSGSGSVTDSRYTYALSSPQGYRVTLITKDGKRVKAPIDIVNSGKDEDYAEKVVKHYIKYTKLEYLNGAKSPEQETKYKYKVIPAKNQRLPQALDFNIPAIKDWFTTKENLMWLCEEDKFDFDYATLVDSPDYKIAVEPLVFINIPTKQSDTVGSVYAMTATEATNAAMNDRQISYNLAAIVRRQLPISMFLEFDDSAIGVKAYKGKTSWGVNEFIPNDVAYNELGLGIIYFTDIPKEPDKPVDPPPKPSKYKYDLIAHSVSTSGTYEEENHFGVSGSFEYQQEIECYACDAHCSKCGNDGRMPLTYTIEDWDFRTCGACDGSGMKGDNICPSCKGNGYAIHGACGGTGVLSNGNSCMYERCSGGLLLVKTFSTVTDPNGQRCNNPRCCFLCNICDGKGIIWYKQGMPVTAPTMNVTIDFFVENGKLDYKDKNFDVFYDVKSQRNVTITADKPMAVTDNLNSGEEIGNKIIKARINWSTKVNETNPNNNEAKTNINVAPASDLRIEFLSPNASYRIGTDVYTSFVVYNDKDNRGLNIRPKHNVTVDLNITAWIGDSVQNNAININLSKQVIVPKGKKNIVYFKWKIPDNFANGRDVAKARFTATLNSGRSANETNYSNNIAKGDNWVMQYHFAETPDTEFSYSPKGYNYWNVFNSYTYQEYDFLYSGFEGNEYCDEENAIGGQWHEWLWQSNTYYDKTNKTVLYTNHSLTPDGLTGMQNQDGSYHKDAYGRIAENRAIPSLLFLNEENIKKYRERTFDYKRPWRIRSGYGFSLSISNFVESNTSEYTLPQTGEVYFPEFGYTRQYQSTDSKNGGNATFRSMEVTSSNAIQNIMEFAKNPYTLARDFTASASEKFFQDYRRTHFTPLWFPDTGVTHENDLRYWPPYQVRTLVLDCWTPIGMLNRKQNKDDTLTNPTRAFVAGTSISIQGDMYDDRFISNETTEIDGRYEERAR